MKRLYISNYLYHVLAWALITAINFIFIPRELVEQHSIAVIIGSGFVHLFTSLVVFYTAYLVIVPNTIIRRKSYPLFILSSLTLIVVVAFVYTSPFVSRLALVNMDQPYPFRVVAMAMNFVVLVLVAMIVRMSGEYYKSRKARLDSERQALSAELAFLKSQVSPHFMFNTLNNIYALVIAKSDDAPTAVLKLSEMMRYMLHDAGNERVTLSEEVAYLKNFVALQELRLVHSNVVHLDITMPEEDRLLAPLLLIPFLENAFKHGDFSSDAVAVNVFLRVENDKLLYSVMNKTKPIVKDGTAGIGLKNLKRRLDLIYPGRHKQETNLNDNTFNATMEVILE